MFVAVKKILINLLFLKNGYENNSQFTKEIIVIENKGLLKS